MCVLKRILFAQLTIHSSPEIGMHVEIRDPDDKIILSKVRIWYFGNGVVVQKLFLQVYSSEGKFTFTSHTPGEHVICLYR